MMPQQHKGSNLNLKLNLSKVTGNLRMNQNRKKSNMTSSNWSQPQIAKLPVRRTQTRNKLNQTVDESYGERHLIPANENRADSELANLFRNHSFKAANEVHMMGQIIDLFQN